MARKSAAAAYSVHPSIAYAQAIVENLPARTGRSIKEWVALVRKEGPSADKERVAWLKKAHGVGDTTAHMIVEMAAGRDGDWTAEGYLKAAPAHVEAMYAGPKAALRPIHDALIKLGRSLGPDVKVCPCQTIVPLYRNHVFAEVKPSTRTRVDFGLALRGVKGSPPPRFKDTGGLARKDRITHRVGITKLEEIDDEVKEWLQTAYDLDFQGD